MHCSAAVFWQDLLVSEKRVLSHTFKAFSSSRTLVSSAKAKIPVSSLFGGDAGWEGEKVSKEGYSLRSSPPGSQAGYQSS